MDTTNFMDTNFFSSTAQILEAYNHTPTSSIYDESDQDIRPAPLKLATSPRSPQRSPSNLNKVLPSPGHYFKELPQLPSIQSQLAQPSSSPTSDSTSSANSSSPNSAPSSASSVSSLPLFSSTKLPTNVSREIRARRSPVGSDGPRPKNLVLLRSNGHSKGLPRIETVVEPIAERVKQLSPKVRLPSPLLPPPPPPPPKSHKRASAVQIQRKALQSPDADMGNKHSKIADHFRRSNADSSTKNEAGDRVKGSGGGSPALKLIIPTNKAPLPNQIAINGSGQHPSFPRAGRVGMLSRKESSKESVTGSPKETKPSKIPSLPQQGSQPTTQQSPDSFSSPPASSETSKTESTSVTTAPVRSHSRGKSNTALNILDVTVESSTVSISPSTSTSTIVPAKQETTKPSPISNYLPDSRVDGTAHTRIATPTTPPNPAFTLTAPTPSVSQSDFSTPAPQFRLHERNPSQTSVDGSQWIRVEPLPLNVSHMRCFQSHRTMVGGRNTYAPLPCMACHIDDRSVRFRCVFCYVRICGGCMQTLRETPGRDLSVVVEARRPRAAPPAERSRGPANASSKGSMDMSLSGRTNVAGNWNRPIHGHLKAASTGAVGGFARALR